MLPPFGQKRRMEPPLLMLQDICLSFGASPVLNGAEIGVGPRERICLVGTNGSGKSTLLKIAAGIIAPDRGTRVLQPTATLRYLPQEPDLSGFQTVLGYVVDGLDTETDVYRARSFLDQLGLAETNSTDHLSGGELRRAALARIVAAAPDVLLLDEPTNHLDVATIEWLENELDHSHAGIVVISHDRRFLERVARRIVWLDNGRTSRLDRSFSHFEAWRDEVFEQDARNAHKLSRLVSREEDWLRYGISARRKRNVRRIAELSALRQREHDKAREPREMQIVQGTAPLSGRIVIDANAITTRFFQKTIVHNLSLRVVRGDRLGIVGENGIGKTTLLKILTCQEAPDCGNVVQGANVIVATLDQQRAALDPTQTLAETLTGGNTDTVNVNGDVRHVTSYMKDFLFRPEQARNPVGLLSGGERGRLLLAAALARPSNLLVLDEPTNDLDFETLDVLQDILSGYAGTILVISHDRDFLDRITTSTLAAEGNGIWIRYAGSYSDMVSQRRSTETPVIPIRRINEPPKKPASKSKLTNFSFKDRHRLQHLTSEIASIQIEVEKLAATLSDSTLFSMDPGRFNEATVALANLQDHLDSLETSWLELELRRGSERQSSS